MSSFYDLASLVMIPSGKKAGKVYSQKPLTTDGQLAFTRASTATRIGSDGKIEKTRTNLLLQSNQFDTTWGLSSATLTSGQSGYDGTSDAWLLDSSSEGYCFQFLSPGNVGTLSIFAKANSVNNLRLRTFGPSVNADGFFDLINGVVGSSTNLIDSSIQSIGSGWYRCSIVYNNTPSLIRIYPSASSSSSSGTSGSIYIQDGQIEQSLVATNYIETTTAAVSVGSVDNMPRLNYTPGSATSCPSLLLEPQRTNILAHSEYFGSSNWGKTNVTLTSNNTISPDGTQNASKLVATATDSSLQESISVTSGTTYTLSVYLKTVSSTLDMAISLGSPGFPQNEGDGGRYKNITVTNEWKRYTITSTADASAATGIGVGGFNSFSTGEEVYAWGAQLEVGSYATSYIPTFGATVTRVNETLSLSNMQSGVANGATSGTLLVDFEYVFDSLGDSLRWYQSSGQYLIANRAYIYNNTIGYADTWGSSNLPITDNVPTKVIYRLNSLSSGSGFRNGTKGTDQTGTAWADIGNLIFYSNYATIKIKKILFFPTALTDAQCIELTTIDS